MCGILGELRFVSSSGINEKLFSNMLDSLERRGPDSSGIMQRGPVTFGHRRLSIIDLSSLSNQPMIDEATGLMLVFNGTIYNYKELRSQLQLLGHHFHTHGDSEVILKAYAQWGDQCVERLTGMFAFAIWSQREQTLFLARDRLGIKPLYYMRTAQHFCFSSNTQALIMAGADTRIDPVGLHHQFTLHAVIPAPHTLLQGVRKLAPGTSLTITADGKETLQRYWRLNAQRPFQPVTEEQWQEDIEQALRLAVKRRLDIADVPVGILLSGGLDSSLLVALAAEIGGREIQTFSIGFEDQPEEKGSEFEFSDQIVKRYGTKHHQYVIPNNQVLSRLPEAIGCMSEPMVGQDAVAFFLLSEQVAKSVKVVQSGQGADEVFAGYFWYPQMDSDTEPDPTKRFARHYFDRDHSEYLQMIEDHYHGADYTSQLVGKLLTQPLADSFIDQVLRMDVTTLIVDDPVKRVDNMTMAWGLEARVPFLDHELVELAMKMPPALKLGPNQQDSKYILKKIARGRIPDAVIDRPKGYFPMPALKYVRGTFYEQMHAALTSQQAKERGLFNPKYIADLLAHPEDSQHFTRIQGSKLWHCALLEMWLQQHVDHK